MKIIIVLTNSTGKNIAFITDDLVTRTLEKVISLIKQKLIEGVHVVSGEHGPYVRADRNNTETDNLDFLAISVERFLEELKSDAKSQATKIYEDYLETKLKDQPDLISIDGKPRATKQEVIDRLKPLSQAITDAAKKYDIDPKILGAILIDEYVRSGIDDLGDILGRYGILDTSVGLAQIKLNTARDIIAQGYYKDASEDISDSELYDLLANDKTSTQFAAAVIRMHIDRWKPFIDLTDRPEILGTLYSLGKKKAPHARPRSNPRGDKIKADFYPMAKEILGD